MYHVSVAVRAALFAILANLRRLVLPVESAQIALDIRTRSAIAIGKRTLALRKELAKHEASADTLRKMLGSSRCGIEWRHLDEALDNALESIRLFRYAVESNEEQFKHELNLVEEAKARLAEVSTDTMQKHFANIEALERTLKMLG